MVKTAVKLVLRLLTAVPFCLAQAVDDHVYGAMLIIQRCVPDYAHLFVHRYDFHGAYLQLINDCHLRPLIRSNDL